MKRSTMARIVRASTPKPRINKVVYSKLQGVGSDSTKNVVRGILASNGSSELSHQNLNLVRRVADTKELALCAELLLGKDGAYPFRNVGATNRPLLVASLPDPIATSSEVSFVIGHLNGWVDDCTEIARHIQRLSDLPLLSGEQALAALVDFAEVWGASNFLTKKLAFVMSTAGRGLETSSAFAKMSQLVDHARYSSPYYAALEAIDSEFPYFVGTFARTQSLKRQVDETFRGVLRLHNTVPSPMSLGDVGEFLRKSFSMSLVDEVVSVVQLLTIGAELGSNMVPDQHMQPQIVRAFQDLATVRFDARVIFQDQEPMDADFAYYRRSIAFVEFADPHRYRRVVDSTLAPRVLAQVIKPGDATTVVPMLPRQSKKDLQKVLLGFRSPNDYLDVQRSGQFLRTVHFLNFVANEGAEPALTQHEVRSLFENTLGLDLLMSEEEIESLYARADELSKPMITVLALALHKSRSHDEDVDFKFRFSICQHINANFGGKISAFVAWLLPGTPNIAKFVLSVLDRATLQKLYWIVQSADQADIARQEILRAVGKQFERIEYFVEADSIEAQRQVSKLKQYFDDSRVYVDGFAMKKWLIENPTAYTQQYLKLMEHGVEFTAHRTVEVSQDGTNAARVTEYPMAQAFDYILIEVARSAYTQFCTNRDFGIESYLGRRIRHNTLKGVMMSGIDSLWNNNHYSPLSMEASFKRKHEVWLEAYRALVEHVRKDVLQFRADQRPQGILSAELDATDPFTLQNVGQLRNMVLSSRNRELFEEVLVRFCWNQIDPQLTRVSTYIAVDLFQKASELIDDAFQLEFADPLLAQFCMELRGLVHDRFAKLASWFRQPESGFVNASAKQLAELIIVEATEDVAKSSAKLVCEGPYVETVLGGPTVHRIYDCLSVLLRNALLYSQPGSQVRLWVGGATNELTNVGRFDISVTSEPAEKNLAEHKARLLDAFVQDDLGAAMVREGYSGIKKLRYITRTTEGIPTVTHNVSSPSQWVIGFSLTVELAREGG